MNPIEIINGKIAWTHKAGDKYEATGVDRYGKRFKRLSDEWRWIDGINLWRGTKWLVRGGKRYKILSVFN